MKLIIIAVGNKMPSWVTEAFTDYQKRFPPEMKLVLEEIAPVKRNGKNSDEKAKELEAKMILDALPKTSLELGDKVGVWQNLGMDVVLIIGGPNGLTDEVRNKANELWSLSKLTLPHPLVRVFLAETIYRGWSIYANLPYHRA